MLNLLNLFASIFSCLRTFMFAFEVVISNSYANIILLELQEFRNHQVVTMLYLAIA